VNAVVESQDRAVSGRPLQLRGNVGYADKSGIRAFLVNDNKRRQADTGHNRIGSQNFSIAFM